MRGKGSQLHDQGESPHVRSRKSVVSRAVKGNAQGKQAHRDRNRGRPQRRRRACRRERRPPAMRPEKLARPERRRLRSRAHASGEIGGPHEHLWRDYAPDARIPRLRNTLMELYLPVVTFIAERLLLTLPRSIDVDDLKSAGTFGLMDAIDGFDIDRGIKFKTYCSNRIRGAILDELRSQDWVPRLVRLKAHQLVARAGGARGAARPPADARRDGRRSSSVGLADYIVHDRGGLARTPCARCPSRGTTARATRPSRRSTSSATSAPSTRPTS